MQEILLMVWNDKIANGHKMATIVQNKAKESKYGEA
jgi:hypothetical protein